MLDDFGKLHISFAVDQFLILIMILFLVFERSFVIPFIGNVDHLSDPFLENMMGLVTPFAGVHNLDLPLDASSDATENRQIWNLPTPSDGTFSASSTSNTEGVSIRVYQTEDEM